MEIKKRRFLGKTEGFESKKEQAFHQRMLKAYLAGHELFSYGFETVRDGMGIPHRVRKKYKVLQS